MLSPSLINVTVIFEYLASYVYAIVAYFRSEDFFILMNIIWWICLGVMILFAGGIIYFSLKLDAIRRERNEKIFGQKGGKLGDIKKSVKNERWEKIKEKLDSDNPSDWNLAIIEADKILDEMLMAMGYLGENLGERLKTVESSDFLTLNEAWEAHKIRNQIAHENDFVLTQREAKAALAKFEQVFKEFDYI
ncbi:MAG: hypothetical protein WCX70_02175 [Candidatus Paceibacterota bacterium]|jgi:hypothetical protein